MKNTKKLGDFSAKKLDLNFNPQLNIEQPLPPGTPFDHMVYSGDVEKDTAMELNAYQKESREQLRNYQKLMDGIFDTEFWFAVAFKDRDAKEDFLREFGFDALGDKYIDGGKLAKLLRKMKGEI